MDDVSDIFKMYGVDYKEVSVNCIQSRVRNIVPNIEDLISLGLDPSVDSDSITYGQTALISLLDV